MPSLPFAPVFALLSGFAVAACAQGMRFEHQDWELACDNTGTCRAAGYQQEEAQPAVSLLLTPRPARGSRSRVQSDAGHL